jgi:hypothetical protein
MLRARYDLHVTQHPLDDTVVAMATQRPAAPAYLQ